MIIKKSWGCFCCILMLLYSRNLFSLYIHQQEMSKKRVITQFVEKIKIKESCCCILQLIKAIAEDIQDKINEYKNNNSREPFMERVSLLKKTLSDDEVMPEMEETLQDRECNYGKEVQDISASFDIDNGSIYDYNFPQKFEIN